MFLDLSDDEKLELIELLTETIAQEHHEPSPRASVLQAILDKLEAEDAVTAPLSAEEERFVHASASQWKQEVAAEERQIVARQEAAARNASSRLIVLAGCAALLAGLLLVLYARW